jgi:hypothetical protein
MKIVRLALLLLTFFSLSAAKTHASDRYPCENVHTFDFWVGDFEATPWNEPGTPSRGRLHNTREYHGCVILERWMGKDSSGMSTGFYDTSRRAWRMMWVGDDGRSTDLEGSFHDGAMRFTGTTLDPSGKTVRVTNVLQPVSADTIRHTFSVSYDGGKTWSVKSDGRFVRVKH